MAVVRWGHLRRVPIPILVEGLGTSAKVDENDIGSVDGRDEHGTGHSLV